MRIAHVLPCTLVASLATAAPSTQKPGSPLDALPKHIEVLTQFGERASISPDAREIAFVSKSFGDAFAIDLTTRAIRCLTCHVPTSAFLRVLHLATGDYLLIGPPHVFVDDLGRGRGAENQLWFLSRKPGSKPVALGQKNFEGAAVSRRGLRVGWSTSHEQDPALPKGHYELFVADLETAPDGTSAKLVRKRRVLTDAEPHCKLEAQDFFDDDRKMTFACYATFPTKEEQARVMSVELASGKTVDHSNTPIFNEPEGIFPDGKRTLVESDEHARARGQKAGVDGWQIDLYELALDGTGKNRRRLTFFNEWQGWHASNPVVSPDGKFMAFHLGRAVDGGVLTGAGRGVLIYRFDGGR